MVNSQETGGYLTSDDGFVPPVSSALYERPPWPGGAHWAPRPRGE